MFAKAVAGSACFPPLFGPMRTDRADERFNGAALSVSVATGEAKSSNTSESRTAPSTTT